MRANAHSDPFAVPRLPSPHLVAGQKSIHAFKRAILIPSLVGRRALDSQRTGLFPRFEFETQIALRQALHFMK